MKRKTRKQLPQLLVAGAALGLGIGGLGYMTVKTLGQITADQYGCYAEVYAPQTVVIVDASEPRWDNSQGRSLETYFDQTYDGLAFNERLSIYTTEGDRVASVVKPSFHVCGQATISDELPDNAAKAQAGYLLKQKQRLFEKIAKPEFDALLTQSPDASRRQNAESPIFEMIRAVQRSAKLEAGDRLILVSDMIQNSDTLRFCRTRGDMPAFSTIEKSLKYQNRLKPAPFDGVSIELLMLQRYGYGQGGLAHCYSEEELRGVWMAYFKANGADDVNIIRVRYSAKVE